MRLPLSALLFLILLAVSPPAQAWGELGHRLIADLAWTELTPQVQAKITVLLENESDPSLPGIANWADELRDQYPDLGKFTARWHYINMGEDGCRYDASSQCPNGDCVIETIRLQAAILADSTRVREDKIRALKFVVHFVGDAHQPLHTAYARDKGGNTTQVNLSGKGSNLHSLWDSGLINHRAWNKTQWLSQLRILPVPPTDAAYDGNPQHWAEASCAIATRPGFYPKNPRIKHHYVREWMPVIEKQLRIGGHQLALILNAALSSPVSAIH